MAEIFDWLAPVPFWDAGGTEPGDALIRPALLEFASDTFMDDFLAEATSTLDSDWQKLKRRVVPYQSPSDAPEDETDSLNPLLTNITAPLKLFHPAHQRYYLLCASLCCRQPGFPDRDVRKADGESVFYVLRKVDKTGREFGWVVDGLTKQWQEVKGNKKSLLDKEDRLPMFATGVCCSRSVQYGYLAVASRDTYKGDVPAFNANAAEERNQWIAQLNENVIRPLEQLMTNGLVIPETVRADFSYYLVSDLGDYLASYITPVADAIKSNPAPPNAGADLDLWNYLGGKHLSGSSGLTWRDALFQMYAQEANLAFRIAAGDTDPAALLSMISSALPTPVVDSTATKQTKLPKLTADDGEMFQIRCVYERPCDAPFPSRLLVSQPTFPFRMAAFFDSDAPARPIRIEMPIDVSIGAMRKFRKGVGFMASNAMRNKMGMATDGLIKDPPKPNGEDSWTLGLLCSFSIQIIFIVAFFLLLIFVIVFNLVFWWLPFFRICLPIPKKSSS